MVASRSLGGQQRRPLLHTWCPCCRCSPKLPRKPRPDVDDDDGVLLSGIEATTTTGVVAATRKVNESIKPSQSSGTLRIPIPIPICVVAQLLLPLPLPLLRLLLLLLLEVLRSQDAPSPRSRKKRPPAILPCLVLRPELRCAQSAAPGKASLLLPEELDR